MTRISNATAVAVFAVAASVGAGRAEAKGWKGAGIGFGIAAGALIMSAAAAPYYVERGYVVDTGYRECRNVQRINPHGYVRTIRVCDVAAY